MKLVFVALAALIVIVGIILIVGSALPVKHVASRTQVLKSSSSQVWQAISDYKGAVNWRSDLQSVEQVEINSGTFAWREISKSGDALTYVTLEATPETKWVRKIIDEDLPFGGSWIFELKTEEGKTILNLTEEGEVYNPVFRFMARFVFGHQATMDRYLRDLKKHLGE